MARVWVAETILRLLSEADGVTATAIAQAVDRPLKRALESLQTLVTRGLASRQGSVYRLTEAGRIAAGNEASVRAGAAGQPRKARDHAGSLRTRAWRALRMEGGKSTLGNILNLVLEGEEKSPGTNLLTYFNALRKAGILTQSHRRVRGNSPTSNGFVVWFIAQDIGPAAPVYQPTKKQVFDPNTDTVYPLLFNQGATHHGNTQTTHKNPGSHFSGAAVAG